MIFDPDEGRIEKPRQKRERGSVFQGRIKMTREEFPQVCDYLRSLLLLRIDVVVRSTATGSCPASRCTRSRPAWKRWSPTKKA